jgi:hypothetical protein
MVRPRRTRTTSCYILTRPPLISLLAWNLSSMITAVFAIHAQQSEGLVRNTAELPRRRCLVSTPTFGLRHPVNQVCRCLVPEYASQPRRRVVSYGDELAPNHPGYHDEAYRTRRKELGVLALGYKQYASFSSAPLFSVRICVSVTYELSPQRTSDPSSCLHGARTRDLVSA